jgi:hypothetical protein
MSASSKILVFIAVAGVLALFSNAVKNSLSSSTVAAAPAEPQSCTAADFSVSKTKAVTEYDEAKLTGVVTNHCASSAGIRLKWTAYNSDGTVAFSNDFWPASTSNIPPHSDYSFEMMDTAPRGKWTYTVQPVSVDIW